ncbi:MAG: hypothetical protein IPL28_24020 [Chloroflexi bacterium]|nr:hypothetical protein [Chloroflexota bacterium]
MRTLLLGLDAFDPVLFERLYERGEMPHLGKYVQRGGMRGWELQTHPKARCRGRAWPRGKTPAGMGLFDFVHRDPASYTPFVSLLPTAAGWRGLPSPAEPHPHHFRFCRIAGFPSTALWWPAHFPARPQEPIDTLRGWARPMCSAVWGGHAVLQ